MKKTLFIFLCLVMRSGFAQKATVNFGPELIRPRKTEIKDLIGADSNSFYCLRATSALFRRDELYLEKYSLSALKMEYIRPFKIPEINGHKLTMERMFLLENQILVFASYYDRSLDKNLLYLMKMNTREGVRIDTPREIDYIVSDKKSNRGSFDFVMSNDYTKILILHNEPFDKYENQKFSYKLIDADGNEFWRASFTLPYRDDYFTLSDYTIDEDGKLYMLAKITKDREERERRQPSYTYNLISYDNNTDSVKEARVNLGSKYISDISFVMAGNKIILAGFYSNKDRTGVAGTFYVTVDKTDQHTINRAESDFSDEFMSGFMSERKAKKNKEIYNYKIGQIITKSDGGIYIVAEQYFINVVTTCQPRGGCTTTYYYNYNNIIVVSFNSDANMTWARQIPKTQISANDYGFYSSYIFNVKNDQLYFLYNDDPKNYSKPRKYPRNGITKRMVTVLAAIDQSGNLQRNALFSSKQEKIYTRPKISAALSPDQSLFYAIKKKKYKFGIITYP